MCIASKFIESLADQYKDMQREMSRLSKLQSEYDKKVSDVYHTIETTNFHAADGYCLAKALQTILIERRKIKNELFNLNSIIQLTEMHSFVSKVTKAKERLHKHHDKQNEFLKNVI